MNRLMNPRPGDISVGRLGGFTKGAGPLGR
jgi:hypothetical protein